MVGIGFCPSCRVLKVGCNECDECNVMLAPAVPCQVCKGDGISECVGCSGSGLVAVEPEEHLNVHTCPTCNGVGSIVTLESSGQVLSSWDRLMED